ncbi:MAG TPA: DUF4412 domain-containing protein [Gemmatimonadaceae bacterium]|nr:DUF4412 domain-containing protein [Gemmatimonadaceae bacterium]
MIARCISSRSLLIVAVAVCVTAVATTANAQKTFAGTINYDVTLTDKQMQISISSRDKLVRQDFVLPQDAPPEAQTYQIFDYGNGNVTTVLPGMKKYMMTNLKTLRDAMAQSGDSRDDHMKQTLEDIKSTSRHETIAGYTCEVYTLKSTPRDEWCITTGLGHFLYFEGATGVDMSNPSAAAGGGSTASLMRTFKDGAVVLRMRMMSRNGETVSMVATKVDRTTPPATLFVLPANFEEMSPFKAP